MLPMIMSMLGTALGPAAAGATGIAALANPLVAGAIGSGLGGAIQGGSLEDGIKAGLGSFFGGAALGKLFGGMGGMLGGTATSGAGQVTSPFSTSPGAMAGRAMNFASSPQGIGSAIGASLASPVKVGDKGKSSEQLPVLSASAMPRAYQPPPAGYRPGLDPEWNYGISAPHSSQAINERNRSLQTMASGGYVAHPAMLQMMGAPPMRLATGGIVDLAGMGDPMPEMADNSALQPSEMMPQEADPMMGSAMPGPEAMSDSGMNEKEVVSNAIAAIKGEVDQPEIALGAFLQMFGEDALRQLVDAVQSGEYDDTVDRFASGENGIVRGPGDGSGVDDMVPASNGPQDVLLSDGEYVLRKNTADAIERKFGGGFLDAVNEAEGAAPDVIRSMVGA